MIKNTSATLLLVEPHEPTQLIIMMALETEGIGVLPADNFTDAVAFAKAARFDACITELQLPDGAAWDLCPELLKAQREMRILYYTRDTAAAKKAMRTCGHAVLRKPVCMADLKEAVFALLGKAPDTAHDLAQKK